MSRAEQPSIYMSGWRAFSSRFHVNFSNLNAVVRERERERVGAVAVFQPPRRTTHFIRRQPTYIYIVFPRKRQRLITKSEKRDHTHSKHTQIDRRASSATHNQVGQKANQQMRFALRPQHNAHIPGMLWSTIVLRLCIQGVESDAQLYAA